MNQPETQPPIFRARLTEAGLAVEDSAALCAEYVLTGDFPVALDFIHKSLQAGDGAVLVHCAAGEKKIKKKSQNRKDIMCFLFEMQVYLDRPR